MPRTGSMPRVGARQAAVVFVVRSQVVMLAVLVVLVVSSAKRHGVRSGDQCGEERAQAKDDHEQRSRATAVEWRHGDASPKLRRRPHRSRGGAGLPMRSVASKRSTGPLLSSDA